MDETEFPRRAYVDLALSADIFRPSVPDAVIGKLFREHVGHAMAELKKLIPEPTLASVESRLYAYDKDEWEAYARANGLRDSDPTEEPRR